MRGTAVLRFVDSPTGGDVVFRRPAGVLVRMAVRVRSANCTASGELRALIVAVVDIDDSRTTVARSCGASWDSCGSPLPSRPAGEPGTDEPGAADLPALRLAVLSVPYAERLVLDSAAITRAAETLDRWRCRVTGWADQPSAPIPPELVRSAYGALSDNVNVPGVLDILERLAADSTVPAGAKFQTFGHLDRPLGLDLPRYLGSSG